MKRTYAKVRSYGHLYGGGHIHISVDEKTLFCAVEDRLHVVDIATTRVKQAIPGDGESLTAFVVLPGDDRVVCCSRSLQMKLWSLPADDSTTGPVMVKNWKAHEAPVLCAAVDASSTLLATGSSDRTIKLYDLDQGFFTHNLKGQHQGIITALLFLPNANQQQHMQLCSAAEDGSIILWDLVAKQPLFTFNQHMAAVTCLCLCGEKSKTVLVSGGRDKVLNVWDLTAGKHVKTIVAFDTIESLALVVAAGEKKNKKKAKKRKIEDGLEDGQEVVEDERVVACGGNGLLKIWNLKTAVCETTTTTTTTPATNSDYQYHQVLFLPLQSQIVTSDSNHNIIFHNNNNNIIMSNNKIIVGHIDQVIDTKYIDSDHIAVATNSELIYIFNKNDWTCTAALAGHTGIVMSLDLSPDRSYLVSGAKDNTVRVWQLNNNATTISTVMVGEGHMGAVSSVAFSKKKSNSDVFIVSASDDNTIKLWSPTVASARMTMVAHNKDINAVAVAPNDVYIATASQDKTVKIWKRSDLSLVQTMRGHKRGVWTVDFSPVDKVVVSGSADSTVRVWSLADGSCVKTMEGHSQSVLRAVFVTMGLQLVSCGSDGVVKLWTVKSGECVQTIDAHEDKVWAVAVNEDGGDGGEMVTGGGDSLLHVWKDVTKEQEDDEIALKHAAVVANQELMNMLKEKKYTDAVKVALDLEQPARLFHVFESIIELDINNNNDNENNMLTEEIKKLSMDNVRKCLLFIRDWNTSSKQSFVAQTVLHVIMTNVPINNLKAMKDISSIIEGIIPYTDRHLQRVNKLIQQSYFIDYTVNCIKHAGTN